MDSKSPSIKLRHLLLLYLYNNEWQSKRTLWNKIYLLSAFLKDKFNINWGFKSYYVVPQSEELEIAFDEAIGAGFIKMTPQNNKHPKYSRLCYLDLSTETLVIYLKIKYPDLSNKIKEFAVILDDLGNFKYAEISAAAKALFYYKNRGVWEVEDWYYAAVRDILEVLGLFDSKTMGRCGENQ